LKEIIENLENIAQTKITGKNTSNDSKIYKAANINFNKNSTIKYKNHELRSKSTIRPNNERIGN
jgi:hypothetical protein